MNERVKTVAMVLFLVIVGLVLYQMYFGELSVFQAPVSPGSPTPTPNSSYDEISENANTNNSPTVRVIENGNMNSTVKLVIPQNSNSSSADLGDPFAQFLNQSGFSNVHMEEIRQEKEIFAIRVEGVTSDISKKYAYEGSTMIGVLYDVPQDVSYEQLQSSILDKISSSPVWSMNETNSYGRASFYLNNKNRSDTVFLLVKFNDRTLGFEYQKNNQVKFERMFSLLGK